MENKQSVEEYLATLNDKQTAEDSQVLIDMMQRISGHEPKLYNAGTIGFGTYHCTIGFGTYHYKYDSGHEGDAVTICFYPRKNKITIYLMDGTARYPDLLAKLGKHTITGYCLYIKQLSDIELPVLEQIVRQSNEFITAKAQDGPIDKILWKTETA